ncbi:hypothetical protein B0H13DRAFT_2045386 [Mycena leptocephala]|nr:hypothetical protein B0H13DRAFT_2045386 [Mycena leptocephala]
MDAITGALLVGTWASSVLYTAELYQAMYYYRHFKNDNWRLKTLVLVVFFIDTVALLNDYACVYLHRTSPSCPHPIYSSTGDIAYFADQNWTIPAYVFTTTAVAVPVQTFLVTRYWKLTHKHVITLLLSLLILAGFSGSFTCGMIDRFKLKIPAILWLVTEAAADLGIAAALLWEFLRTRQTSTETRNVLNRLATVTLQTGTATATIAVAALVGNIGVGFAWCLGRAYVLSMLSNLNIRQSARVWTPSTSKAATSTTHRTSVAFAQPGTEMATNLSGLSVVHIESQQDPHPGTITIKSSMHGPEHTTDIEMGPLSWRKGEEELTCGR